MNATKHLVILMLSAQMFLDHLIAHVGMAFLVMGHTAKVKYGIDFWSFTLFYLSMQFRVRYIQKFH